MNRACHGTHFDLWLSHLKDTKKSTNQNFAKEKARKAFDPT
jgi:hypothetical protein